MAISKRERERLERILSSLERGLAFIDRPGTFLATKASHGGAMAFSRNVTQGQVDHVLPRNDPFAYAGEQHVSLIDKHIGSEFALIRNARRELAAMLSPIECDGG